MYLPAIERRFRLGKEDEPRFQWRAYPRAVARPIFLFGWPSMNPSLLGGRVDWLYHETFLESEAHLAEKTRRCTAAQAAGWRQWRSQELLMGHYSARYKELDLQAGGNEAFRQGAPGRRWNADRCALKGKDQELTDGENEPKPLSFSFRGLYRSFGLRPDHPADHAVNWGTILGHRLGSCLLFSDAIHLWTRMGEFERSLGPKADPDGQYGLDGLFVCALCLFFQLDDPVRVPHMRGYCSCQYFCCPGLYFRQYSTQ